MTQHTPVSAPGGPAFGGEATFDNLGIAPKLLDILRANKFTKPTPIQHQCIPQGIEGKDIVGIAQTGTGKTLAFGVPLLQRLAQHKGQALILVPTRELALQVDEMLQKIGRSLGLRTAVVIGGVSPDRQIRALRSNPHVVIATPGRLIDHMQQKYYSLNQVKVVVLDEADRMFDIGFLPYIKQILEAAPKDRQTLLFSATMPAAIAGIAAKHMKMPLRVEVAPAGTSAKNVEQEIFILQKPQKLQLLEKLLAENPGTVLIFSRTKYGAKKITTVIRAMGHQAAEIHSNRSQAQRTEAMTGFRHGKYRILVATDIAARGIDVSNISLVINYDLPENSEDYVHRIGRTGRADALGKAISFATPDQRGDIRQIERLIKKTIPILDLPHLPPASDSVVRAIYANNDPAPREGRGRPFNRNAPRRPAFQGAPGGQRRSQNGSPFMRRRYGR